MRLSHTPQLVLLHINILHTALAVLPTMDRLSKYRRTIRPRHTSAAKSANKSPAATISADSGLPNTIITTTSLTTASSSAQQPRGTAGNNVVGGIGAQIYQHNEPKLRSCANWVNSLPLVYSPIMSPTSAASASSQSKLRSSPPKNWNLPPILTDSVTSAALQHRKRKADLLCDDCDQQPHQQARRQRRNSDVSPVAHQHRPPELPAAAIDHLTSTVSSAISSLTNQTAATLPPEENTDQLNKSPTVTRINRVSPIKEIFKRVRFAVRSGNTTNQKVSSGKSTKVRSTPAPAKKDVAHTSGPSSARTESVLKKVRFSLRRKSKDEKRAKRCAEDVDISFESTNRAERR